MMDGQEILEEEYDPNYEPTREDLESYADILGMKLPEDEDLLWIAREGLKAPLPPSWRPCVNTSTDEVYYFNFETEESTWEHPCDKQYREIYQENKKNRQTGNSRGLKRFEGNTNLSPTSSRRLNPIREEPSPERPKTAGKALGRFNDDDSDDDANLSKNKSKPNSGARDLLASIGVLDIADLGDSTDEDEEDEQVSISSKGLTPSATSSPTKGGQHLSASNISNKWEKKDSWDLGVDSPTPSPSPDPHAFDTNRDKERRMSTRTLSDQYEEEELAAEKQRIEVDIAAEKRKQEDKLRAEMAQKKKRSRGEIKQ
eukprot:m.108414 g.108414  ORF g.108414 m.108414 type:complete len:314 (+) comp13961_c0_seq1:348-1289(+)